MSVKENKKKGTDLTVSNGLVAVEKRIRDAFKQYVTPGEASKLVQLALFQSRIDNTMLRFCLEHIFGKAAESVTLGGIDGQPIQIQISEVIAMKNKLRTIDVTHTSTK